MSSDKDDRRTIRIAEPAAQAGIAAALRRAFVLDTDDGGTVEDQLNQLLSRLN